MQSTRPSDRGEASVLVASKTKWLFGWAQKLKIAVSEQTPLRQYSGEKNSTGRAGHTRQCSVLPGPSPLPCWPRAPMPSPGVSQKNRDREEPSSAERGREARPGPRRRGAYVRPLSSVGHAPRCSLFLRGRCPLPPEDQVGAVAQGCGSGLSASPRWGCTWVCMCAWHIHRPTHSQVHSHTLPTILKTSGLRSVKRSKTTTLHPLGWPLSKKQKPKNRK